MQPAEIWWLLDGKRGKRMYGSLSEDDARELYDAAVAGGVQFDEPRALSDGARA